MAGAVKAIDFLEDAVKVGCLTVAGIVVSSSALAGAGLIAAGLLLDFKRSASNPAKRAIDKAIKNALDTAKGELMIAYGVQEGPDYAALIERDDAHRAVIQHLRAALPNRDQMVDLGFSAQELAPAMAQRLSDKDPGRLPRGADGDPNAIALTYSAALLTALCAEKVALEDAHAEISAVTLQRVNQLMDEVRRLRTTSVDFDTAQALARRLPADIGDLDAQVRELMRQLDAAEELIAEGSQPGNFDEFVQAVRARVAEKIKQEDFDGALDEANQSFDQWERHEAERQEEQIRNGMALLETAITAAIAKGDAEALANAEIRRVDLDAKRVERELGIEQTINHYVDRARTHGAPIDHETSIILARRLVASAGDPVSRIMALNWLGCALAGLGERESSTSQLIEAVSVYRLIIKDMEQYMEPRAWAAIYCNLGDTLRALGEREDENCHLHEAATAFRSALGFVNSSAEPELWALLQNNVANVLAMLGDRRNDSSNLQEALAAYRAAQSVRTRSETPLEWAQTQSNVGNVLTALARMDNSIGHLRSAIVVYSAALEELQNGQVPILCAMTQHNLGCAQMELAKQVTQIAPLQDAKLSLRSAVRVFEAAGAQFDASLSRNALKEAELLELHLQPSRD